MRVNIYGMDERMRNGVRSTSYLKQLYMLACSSQPLLYDSQVLDFEGVVKLLFVWMILVPRRITNIT